MARGRLTDCRTTKSLLSSGQSLRREFNKLTSPTKNGEVCPDITVLAPKKNSLRSNISISAAKVAERFEKNQEAGKKEYGNILIKRTTE